MTQASIARRVGMMVRHPTSTVFDPALLAIVGLPGRHRPRGTLYSAGNDFPWRVTDQLRNFGVATCIMFVMGEICRRSC